MRPVSLSVPFSFSLEILRVVILAAMSSHLCWGFNLLYAKLAAAVAAVACLFRYTATVSE